jgi:hypothetical protein
MNMFMVISLRLNSRVVNKSAGDGWMLIGYGQNRKHKHISIEVGIFSAAWSRQDN